MSYKNQLLLALGAVVLGACAYTPEDESPPPAPSVSLTRFSLYPLQGQSAEQLDRDRYDCFVWSVDQTGFDPSRRIVSREARALVLPSPAQTAVAAAANAQQQEAGLVEARYDDSGLGRQEREAAEYRRAMSACLEGRGYSVR